MTLYLGCRTQWPSGCFSVLTGVARTKVTDWRAGSSKGRGSSSMVLFEGSVVEGVDGSGSFEFSGDASSRETGLKWWPRHWLFLKSAFKKTRVRRPASTHFLIPRDLAWTGTPKQSFVKHICLWLISLKELGHALVIDRRPVVALSWLVRRCVLASPCLALEPWFSNECVTQLNFVH